MVYIVYHGEKEPLTNIGRKLLYVAYQRPLFFRLNVHIKVNYQKENWLLAVLGGL